MTVQALIDTLNKVKNKGSQVYDNYGYLIEQIEEEEEAFILVKT